MRFNSFIVFVLCLLSILTIGCDNKYSGKKQPGVVNGVLDLKGWDFEKDGPVELTGDWEFF